MKYWKYWFTLVEILISISILLIIVSIVSVTMIQVNQSVYSSQNDISIFDDVNTFWVESYQFKAYQSGIILTDSLWFPSLMLYDENNAGVILWVFKESQLWYNYRIATENTVFWWKYFWYFYVQDFQVQNILTWMQDLTQLNFNDGKLYQNLQVHDLFISPLGSWEIFQFDFQFFRNLPSNLEWKIKSDYFIEKENILEINIVI